MDPGKSTHTSKATTQKKSESTEKKKHGSKTPKNIESKPSDQEQSPVRKKEKSVEKSKSVKPRRIIKTETIELPVHATESPQKHEYDTDKKEKGPKRPKKSEHLKDDKGESTIKSEIPELDKHEEDEAFDTPGRKMSGKSHKAEKDKRGTKKYTESSRRKWKFWKKSKSKHKLAPSSDNSLDLSHKLQDHKHEREADESTTDFQGTVDHVDESDEDSIKNLSTRTIAGILILIGSYFVAWIDSYSFLIVRSSIIQYYGMKDMQVLILQNSFSVAFAVTAPVFGCLGDRVERKTLMMFGFCVWSVSNLTGAFLPESKLVAFLTSRIAFSVGVCLFAVLLHSAFADLFSERTRFKALSVLYLAIPIGWTLGALCASSLAELTEEWQYALIYTWPTSLFLMIMIYTTFTEPDRWVTTDPENVYQTSIYVDLLYLLTNKTFLLSIMASVCLNGVSGYLRSWLPLFLHKANQLKGPQSKVDGSTVKLAVVLGLGGVTGLCAQYFLVRASRWISRSYDVVEAGLFCVLLAPCVYVLFFFPAHGFLTWSFVFITSMTLIGHWAFRIDLIMSIVIPPRRSLAFGVLEFFSKLCETSAPIAIGKIGGITNETFNDLNSSAQVKIIQGTVAIPCILCVLAGMFFLLCYFVVENERQQLKEWRKVDSPFEGRQSEDEENIETLSRSGD